MLCPLNILSHVGQNHRRTRTSSPKGCKRAESLLTGRNGAVELNRGGGFTTIELIIVIAILLALGAIAIPSISGWADNQRLKGVTRDLFTHFQLARLEAVKRSTTVVLTFNPGGPQSGNYTVFVDDGSGGGTADNLIQDNMQEETLARTIMPFGVTLTGTTFAADRTGYNSRGFPVGATFTDTEGKVTVANDNRSYEVTLQRTSGGLSLDGPL